MNVFTTIIFIINFFSISTYQSDEIINELAPKTINFRVRDANTYKIFEFTPLCKNNNSYYENFYIQVHTFQYFNLYIYFDLSKIDYDRLGFFINEKEKDYFNTRFTSQRFYLQCGVKNYILISNHGYSPLFKPSFALLSIIREDSEVINISPSISDFFIFNKRKDKKETFIYSYNETKYALINYDFDEAKEFKIFEDDNIIYDINISKSKILFEFKKNKNYTIYYDLYKNYGHMYSYLISFFFFNLLLL